ncbi:MAG: TonB-dependent receptor, partial [Pseudomonadota bacterium]
MGISVSAVLAVQARLAAAALIICVSLVVGVQAVPAAAQSRTEVNIPAGRLSSAIRTLSRQTRVSIASSDRGLRKIRSRSVRGNLSTGEALRRLLQGTPFRAVNIRGGGFRIERKPQPRRVAASPARPATTPKRQLPPPPPPQPIIVEATKRSAASIDYAGGIRVLDLAIPGLVPAAAGLDELLTRVPSVSGTALGTGRNKIFLRGIADSSFNGPTQSTIGLYLGEQRVIFSAPNPDLRLVDVETVELLEGPQGSLYGAGTLAGLLRVNPRAADPSGFASEGWVGGAITPGAEAGWD